MRFGAIGNDWYCCYQHKDHGGRRLMWNEAKSRHRHRERRELQGLQQGRLLLDDLVISG
ncbi:hypothetical protein [Streptomyces sp. NPDC059816]|uniref:hypothetical protein n=1 Tax=Streptomyces sp. NPDC059816 TaxID=3346960 RepID=UPI003667714F